MKNNKGIILSTYIYILLVFFILILSTMLMVLNNTKIISTKLKNSANPSASQEDSFSIVLVGGDVSVAKGSTYIDKGYVAQTTGGTTLTAIVTSTVNTATVGTYTYKYEVTYGVYKKSVTRTVYVIESVYYYSYTGAVQTFTVPATGYYKTELWGARSGNLGTGFGAYTSGYIYMVKDAVYYLYVGGVGSTTIGTNIAGGYNGGGNAGTVGASRSGGGATDIRLIGGTWNDANGLRSRIMVAAGGGAGENNLGGIGGALMGGPNHAGTFSTQVSGSAFGYATTPTIDASGAGGGYYGGVIPTADGVAAGGGSSFISGYAGVNAILGLNSFTPGNNTNHYSGKYFINGQMMAGINNGNGRAKITYFDINMPARVGLNNVRYIKDCINGSNSNTANHWVELQAIYNGDNVALNKTVVGTAAQNATYPYSRITDGDITSANYSQTDSTGLQCITVDLGQSYNLDEVAIWHYWADGRSYYSNTTYTSSNNSTWDTVISTSEVETSQGKRANSYTNYYYYTGGSQTFTASKTGYYSIDLFGAQGGKAGTYISNLAAKTSGKIYLQKDDTLTVNVGGAGISNCTTPACLGGYNGGGKGENAATANVIQASGGGATDIRYGGTSVNARIMVAGGSGGASSYLTNWYGTGGSGGSMIGFAGSYGGTAGSATYPGYGGTQISGGAAANCVVGTFGYGGTRDAALAGGGGGYYGGGCGWGAGGGGGSSFISGYAGSNAITSSSSTTATNNTIHYSNKYFIEGKIQDGINSGSGMASIHYASPAKSLKTNNNLNNVRYIKDCMTGTTEATSNAYWAELQAIKDGVNIALNKSVVGSNAINTYHSSTYAVVTNGIVSNDRYELACSTEVTTAKCVTVDLGQSYDLDEIAIWHVFNTISNNNVTSVSSNNSTWTTAISTVEYETTNGKRISIWD